MGLNYPWMKQASMTKTQRQVMTGIILLAVGLALASVPNRFEGPSLLHISKGHGVSVSDVLALIPLLWGAATIVTGLWPTRTQVLRQARGWVQTGGVEIFLAGLAAGVIINRLAFDVPWGRMLIWVVIAAGLGLRWLMIERRA